ncbi:thiamine phosphate synthase [Pimelobacter simplex]|uniref:thiamine phosphate synthase n=1 Tax=Nocardioides simplex TaxID=2045 RepID=UPI0005362153|nr:thiamine phosphate synthase [Pimelobacter simplex]MCG8154358.1 thiamine phosphate synthase [Pimelobacter simplex]GEB11794.1 putative thiamine-phosphate synthase [Pimelobacter simplex]SFN01793.1 thiamine-phosphate pyrophosphorylase [Pimelobacter simplex]
MSRRLVVLTDRRQVPEGRSLRDVLGAAADAGLRIVLLREVDLPDDERAKIADHARSAGLEVIAAHRPVAGCVGVHLPADGALPEVATRWGRSCHGRADLLRAAADGAWWATLSPYGVTESKPGYGPPLPASAFAAPPLPVFALGGITPENAAVARRSGAYGVAVMGAVMRAADPATVVAALLREVVR